MAVDVKQDAATGASRGTSQWVFMAENAPAANRDLLGGKGAGLAAMTQAGLPVPPAFTITTAACNAFQDAGGQFPAGLWDQTLAALQSIPVEMYQAATVDGAGRWQQFRRITLPMLAPGTTISVTLSLITMLKLYDIIVALTSGGPANSTESTALYIIKLAFTDDRFGYASAVAMLLLAVSAVIALSVTGLLRRREVDL